ncbi:MAG: TonB-dependent receptor [Bacteroidetes bacterium]|nr:TonB-dependent receptor [Bacteroidota bacterium]
MKYYILLLIFVSFIPVLYSQQNPIETGIIKGEVLDRATKEPLIGANILVVGTTIGSSADAGGQFSISRVPIGIHSLRVTAVGYTPFIATDIIVTVAKPAEVKIFLDESTILVDEVQVTASYFQTIPDRPISNLIQSNEEIRRIPGGLEDVVRAISILPGVAQVQAGRNDLIIRGGAPSENLFIVDNIEVPNINHFGTQGASGGPLSFVNLDYVQQTSFSTGGFGVQYGDKLSSVLTLDLSEGRKDRFGGKATISASQFGLNLEGPVGQNGSFLFSARRSYLDFIFKAAGFGFVPEYWDFLGKINYQLSKSDQLVILGVSALDDTRLINDTPDKRFDNSQVLGSNQDQFIGGISWRHLLKHGFTTISLGQTYVDYEYMQNDSLLNPIFKTSSFEHESTLRGDLLTHVAEHAELSIGVQFKAVRFSNDIFLARQTTSFGDTIEMDALYKSKAVKASAYLQFSQGIDLFRFTLGGRIDYFDLIKDKFVFAPRFSAVYALTPLMNLSASMGRYYQAPSYIWLAANPINRELKHTGADHYIIGIDYMIQADTKISVEAYIKKYFDYPASLTRTYLVLANTGAGFGGSQEGFASFGLDPLANAGKGRARGIEFLAQKKLSEIPCYGTVSISYNESEFTAIDGVTRPSSFDQRWIINLGGGYILNEKWEFSTKFRYATGRPYTPFDAGGIQSNVLYNTFRIEANHSLDVRVDRRWSFGNWSLTTYIDIQNIYNRKPIDVPKYNQRTGQTEQTGSIGILPSIGVSAEF